jgi:hypothetical protein
VKFIEVSIGVYLLSEGQIGQPLTVTVDHFLTERNARKNRLGIFDYVSIYRQLRPKKKPLDSSTVLFVGLIFYFQKVSSS